MVLVEHINHISIFLSFKSNTLNSNSKDIKMKANRDKDNYSS